VAQLIQDAPPLVVAAVGDIMLGSTYPDARGLPPRDGADVLRAVTPLLSHADLTFGNLEGPLCDSGTTKKCGPNSHAFRVPTRFGRHLKAAGFDVLSLANNHAGDFGPAGREETRRTLDFLGITHAGGGHQDDVGRLTVNGSRIAVVAFATNPISLNLNDIKAASAAVTAAARTADIVIVSFHGGGEGAARQHVPYGPEMYLGERRGDLRRFAHAVVDAGADLVLGHGPHVVRGMEIYQRRLIAYSLGNFATYGGFSLSGPAGLSLILEARLSPATGEFLGGRVHSLKQPWPGGPIPDPTGSVIPVAARLSREDFGPVAVRFAADGTISPPPDCAMARAGR
jgi:poly-gamma-glutamate capsule biosynthesis protein CapA/YwtB (metallophosphatase superfamily)